MGLVAQNAMLAFACPNCGEHYEVTPQYTGRYVRCWCGMTIGVPAYTQQAKSTSKIIPAQEVENVSADLEAQLLRPCPRCRYLLEPKVMICMHCGYDRDSGRVLHTTVDAMTPKLTAEQIEERWQRSWAGRILRWKSWQIPLALVVICCYLLLALWSFAVGHLGEVDLHLGDIIEIIVLECSVILGIFLLMELNIGPWWSHGLKLLSIASVVAVVEMLAYIFLGETALYYLQGDGIFIIKLLTYSLMIRWYYESELVDEFAIVGVCVALSLMNFLMEVASVS